MLDAQSPSCDIFIYTSSFNVLYQTLYYLYKSINGKIYILHSLCGFITYYQLIEDESWSTNDFASFSIKEIGGDLSFTFFMFILYYASF